MRSVSLLVILLAVSLLGIAAPPVYAQTTVREWRQLTEANANNADAWLGLATAQVAQGDIRQAMQSYNRAVQLRPIWNQAYEAFALSLLNAGRAEEGITVSKEGVSRAPNNGAAHAALGNAYRYRGDWKNVIASYEHALTLNATDSQRGWWLESLAQAYTYTNDREMARKTLARAAALDPDNFHSHEALAESYMELGDYPKAERAYRDALSLTPDPRNTTRLKELLAAALMAQGKQKEAAALVQQGVEERRYEQERALKNKEYVGAAYQDAAREQRDEGNIEVALQARQSAIDAAPNEPWHYIEYAQDLERVGRDAQAASTYEQSVPLFRAKMEEEPSRREYYRRGLALALKKTGETSETVPLLREETAMEPNNTAAWIALGEALNDEQRYSEAAQAFARVESIAATQPVFIQTRLRAAVAHALATRRGRNGGRRARPAFERAWAIYDQMSAEEQSLATRERKLLDQYAPRPE